MRPSPYRWIPIILVALALFLWISLDLFPRLVETMLGRDRVAFVSGFEGGEQLPEIVWDTRDPRREEGRPTTSESQTAPPVVEETEAAVEETAPESQSDALPPAGGDGGDSASPTGSGESAGMGGNSREQRAATLIFQEWPREELLAELETGGSFRFMLRVEADGSVSKWERLESFDCAACAEEAERIVAGLRFRPALRDGRPSACLVPFEIRFYAPGEN